MNRATRQIAGVLLLLAAYGTLSCSRSDVGQLRRIAILPANVLVPDAAYQWLGIAVPLVLAEDLASAPDLMVSIAANHDSVYELGSELSLCTTIELQSDRFALNANLRAVAAQQDRRVLTSQQPNRQLVGALDLLAKQLDARATPFPTRSQAALEAFVLGLSSPDNTVKVQQLKSAIAADPSFGLAYVTLLEALAAQSDPQLKSTLTLAEVRQASFSPLDRARLEMLRSRLERAAVGQRIAAAEAVLKLTPHDLGALTTAGEGRFLEGDARAGEAWLARAIAVSPQSQDLRRQLALGLLENRQFASAAGILAQLPADPSTSFNLAIALLLKGDTEGAGKAYERFLASVGNADIRTLLQARWQALSGHRAEAIQLLQNAQFSDARVTTLAKSQLVLWQVLDNQRAGAQASARGAGVDAKLFAEGAQSAAAWREKVQSLPPAIIPPEAQPILLRYGYFLLGFYPEAAEAWRSADQQSGGTDLQARTMLAASLRGASRQQDASKLRVLAFVPDAGDTFSVISFTQLRSMLSQAE